MIAVSVSLPLAPAASAAARDAGVVTAAPGLYFVGLHFLYAMSSAMIHGVGRDAKRMVEAIAARAPSVRSHAQLLSVAR